MLDVTAILLAFSPFVEDESESADAGDKEGEGRASFGWTVAIRTGNEATKSIIRSSSAKR